MSEISLQSYENEIDQLIEQARYVEALAHIRHLLSQSPHYVGAYYLLGKTLLEADLPELAVDMFRRALSADPEHLLSRIGLGLAHERRNDLDGAMWNLERALELDPGNADIAEELRQMYGRRDGIELDYVPQTRAGLARLYLRGRLYGRATEELIALLVQQPARPDLMTALAEAHWRNGQLVQAAEVSQGILDKMPYNCKANLLLGSLWVGGGQEEGWTYLRRAQEVDPTNERASELFGAESLLPPADAAVERLTFDPNAIDVDQGSAWFRRLKSASTTMGMSEAPPEMTAAEARLVDITANLEAQIEIPDWLREMGTGEAEEKHVGGLGWMAEIGTTEGPAPDVDVVVAAEEAAPPADVEDLEVRLDAVVEPDVEEVLVEGAETTDVAPEWLQELTTETADLDLEEGEGAPAWLLELVGEQPAAATAGPAVPLEQEIADVLGGEAEVEPETVGWLSEFALDEAEPTVDVTRDVTVIEGLEAPEPELLSAEEIPDWLAELEPAGTEAGTPEAVVAAEEIPDWLAELKPPEADAETTEVVVAAEEVPDWLAELEAEEVEVEVGEGAAAAEEIPDWLTELKSPDVEAEVTEAAVALEETPDWLAALEAEEAQAEEAEAAVAETAVAAEEIPDWLAELQPAETEGALPAEEIPDWLAELKPAEAEVAGATDAAEEIPDWLAGLQPSETGASQIALADQNSPDWLLELEAEAPEIPTGLAEETAVGAPPEEEEGVRSGAAALAWVESLAGGWEEAAPALVEASAAEVPETILEVSEVAAEASTAVEELTIAEETSALPVELPAGEGPAVEGEGDLLSGDDALAWLESLAVGKEEELRLEVERESERRVAEIMGRRFEAPEVVSETAEAELTVIEVPELELEPAVEEAASVEVPVSELAEPLAAELEGSSAAEELLSGEDALAWLESLTVGKEEELRLQVEQESAERAAEILGHKHPVPVDEMVVAETDMAPGAEGLIEDVRAAYAEGEEVVTALAEEAEPVAEAWDEAVTAERVPVEGDQVEETVEAVETLPEAAQFSGEDALTWLEGLTPEEEAELRAEVTGEGAGEMPAAESVPETVFGWSAFGAEPEEALSPVEVAAEIVAPEVVPEPIEVPVVVEEAAVIEAAQKAEPVIAVPEAEEVAAPPALPQPQVETPAEVVAEPELPAPPATPRAEAEPSVSTGTDFDEMRAYLKQKRSDHVARLTFARTLWEAGEISESMEQYGRLIKSGAKSADVTQDLERYAEQRPDGAGVLRTLGDAYMKFGALEKALEIYNRAMHQL